MAQTDTDQEGESVRGGLNSRLKKLLVLIPLAVSIFLGDQALHDHGRV